MLAGCRARVLSVYRRKAGFIRLRYKNTSRAPRSTSQLKATIN